MRNKFATPSRARKTYISSAGYRTFKDSSLAVHRHVAGVARGHPLKSTEVVHHKDRNKLNNSPSNLQVFNSQKAHDIAHKIDAKRYGASYSYKGTKKS